MPYTGQQASQYTISFKIMQFCSNLAIQFLRHFSHLWAYFPWNCPQTMFNPKLLQKKFMKFIIFLKSSGTFLELTQFRLWSFYELTTCTKVVELTVFGWTSSSWTFNNLSKVLELLMNLPSSSWIFILMISHFMNFLITSLNLCLHEWWIG